MDKNKERTEDSGCFDEIDRHYEGKPGKTSKVREAHNLRYYFTTVKGCITIILFLFLLGFFMAIFSPDDGDVEEIIRPLLKGNLVEFVENYYAYAFENKLPDKK